MTVVTVALGSSIIPNTPSCVFWCNYPNDVNAGASYCCINSNNNIIENTNPGSRGNRSLLSDVVMMTIVPTTKNAAMTPVWGTTPARLHFPINSLHNVTPSVPPAAPLGVTPKTLTI
ncbi:putative crustin-like antimicrobial peptide 15 [Homarus americanus]|nr:putative crustin-like antimicrobial peptide 15 [Homarus americanus]